MSSQKHHQLMRNLDRCYDAVLQNSTKGGITAAEIAKKIGMHKTMVHRNLNTLELMGKVEDHHGTWRVKTGEQTPKHLEKEIVIELPIPKNEWQRIALLEDMASLFGENDPDNAFKTSLQKLKETRTIRITGKNVDDLDLEKVATLIQEANRKSSLFNLRGLLKNFRRSKPQAQTSSET